MAAKPRPITEQDRQQVKDLHAAGLGRNDISRELGRAAGTISKIASELGLSFGREQTAAATHAKVQDAKARRVELAQALLDDVAKLRQRAWAPYTIALSGPEGIDTITLTLPPLRDQQSAYQAIGTCVTKHLDLTRHDADPGLDAGKSMLSALAEGLGEAYKQLAADAG
jgi:IS30 family transposase